MVNKSQKGADKERQCLFEYITLLTMNKIDIIDTWHTHRGRWGGNDYHGCDLSVLSDNGEQRQLSLIQVKSTNESQEVEKLRSLWATFYPKVKCYLAVYGKVAPKKYDIKLPHFWLIKC